MGTVRSRVDAKGRVSIPASFRAALRDRAGDPAATTVILLPSQKYPCIEAWTERDHAHLATGLEQYPVFSPERDTLTHLLFGDAQTVDLDREGRVVLPDDLRARAGIGEGVMFIGLRDKFQIWDLDAGDRHKTGMSAGPGAGTLTLSPGPLAPATAAGSSQPAGPAGVA